jgi:hypothetical protein
MGPNRSVEVWREGAALAVTTGDRSPTCRMMSAWTAHLRLPHRYGRSAHNGITMLLVTVEAWPDSVIVRVAGMPNERTARLDAEFDQAMRTWAAARALGDDSRPPQDPGASALERLGLTIRDAAGTPYRLVVSSTGGTGTEWRGEWVFRPGPPASSRNWS